MRIRRAMLVAAAAMTMGHAGTSFAASELDNAPVPSLCGHPAGTLVDGVLPGVPENEGGVWLGFNGDSKVVKGSIRPGIDGDLAAVLDCNRGGVAWPENIVFYDAAHNILGAVDLYDVTRGGREGVRRLWFSGGALVVEVVNIQRKEDAACCGSGSARVRLDLGADGKVSVLSRTVYTERSAAQKLITAVNRRQRTTARRYGTSAAVSALFSARKGAHLGLVKCYGLLSDEAWWINDISPASRSCLVSVNRSGPYDSAYAVHMERVSWNKWRARAAQGVAG